MATPLPQVDPCKMFRKLMINQYEVVFDRCGISDINLRKNIAILAAKYISENNDAVVRGNAVIDKIGKVTGNSVDRSIIHFLCVGDLLEIFKEYDFRCGPGNYSFFFMSMSRITFETTETFEKNMFWHQLSA